MIKNLILSAIIIVFFAAFPFITLADVICLKNGNHVEGIITRETDDNIELQFYAGAKITFSQQEIEYVERASLEENKKLEQKWEEQDKKRKETEEARKKYDAEQRRRGLVKYKGRWVREEERKQLELGSLVGEILDEKAMQSEVAEILDRERSDAAKTLLSKYAWQCRGTEHFMVYYQDSGQGKVIADKAEYYYEKIAYDLDYEENISWESRCKVFIIPDQDKWKEFLIETKVNPEVVGGFINRDKYREIFLCALSLPYLSVVFAHELTHLISEDFAAGGFIPLWLGEGLANYESGVIGYNNELLVEKLKAAEFISLDKLSQLQNYPQDEEERRLFYAESEKLVEFLITQHGRGAFSEFFKLIIADKPFKQAADEAYSQWYRTSADFQKAWIEYIVN